MRCGVPLGHCTSYVAVNLMTVLPQFGAPVAYSWHLRDYSYIGELLVIFPSVYLTGYPELSLLNRLAGY